VRVLDVERSSAEACYMVLVRVEERDVAHAEKWGLANQYLDQVMLEARDEVTRSTWKPAKKQLSRRIRLRQYRGQ
jgi:hypothetical protein